MTGQVPLSRRHRSTRAGTAGRVVGESLHAGLDRRGGDVESEILLVASERQLVAVTATKFDHATDSVSGDEIIQNARLEVREPAIGAGTGVASASVTVFPV